MIEYNIENVGAAFDVLIEEIEDALRSMNSSGANALEMCDYDMAQRAIERARRVKLLHLIHVYSRTRSNVDIYSL